jgi:hypothetical protein
MFAGDHNDATAAEIVGGWKDAAVPEGHDWLAPVGHYPIEPLDALDSPSERRSKQGDGPVSDHRNQAGLEAFTERGAPMNVAQVLVVSALIKRPLT